jgi:hypothetical protein
MEKTAQWATYFLMGENFKASKFSQGNSRNDDSITELILYGIQFAYSPLTRRLTQDGGKKWTENGIPKFSTIKWRCIGLRRWYSNITITTVNIIYSVFCFKNDVSENGFCLSLQVEPTQLVPTDRQKRALYRAQLSRFYLKAETESILRNVCIQIANKLGNKKRFSER